MAIEALRPHDCLLRSSDPRPCHLRARLPHRLVDDRTRRKGSITSVSGDDAAGKVTGGGGGMEPATAGREWLSLRPRQEAVRMQIRLKPSAKNTRGADEYAGTAFSMSPSPRKLPLPSLSWRKEEGAALATKDLRRLLRLE